MTTSSKMAKREKKAKPQTFTIRRTYSLTLGLATMQNQVLDILVRLQVSNPKGVKSSFWKDIAAMLSEAQSHPRAWKMFMEAVPEEFIRDVLDVYFPVEGNFLDEADHLLRYMSDDWSLVDLSAQCHKEEFASLFWKGLKPNLERKRLEVEPLLREAIEERRVQNEARNDVRYESLINELRAAGYTVEKRTSHPEKPVDGPKKEQRIRKTTERLAMG